MCRLLIFLCFLAGVRICAAQSSPAMPPMQEVRENVFKIGAVTFDKVAKTATLSATVTGSSGAVIEYLLVTKTGKTYESLLTTQVNPYDLHLAMLLLGVSPPTGNAALPPDQIDSAYLKNAPKLKGDSIEIQLAWKKEGRDQHAQAEEWIYNTREMVSMTKGAWLYTGSFLNEGKFMAQAEGSLVALITDPVALVNNPRPGHDDDQIWSVQPQKIPGIGTEVEVTFHLLPPGQP